MHLTRFHGLLASHSKHRAQIVPLHPEPLEPIQLPLVFLPVYPQLQEPTAEPTTARAGRHPWAWLLKRVFQADLSTCPKCHSRMRIVEIALTAEAIARTLARHDLASPPPPRAPPVHRAQLALALGA